MKVFSPEHVDLANWVRTQLREGCTRAVLRQRMGEHEQHVREWVLDPNLDADALAQEIRVKASDEGRQLRGPTLYGIFAYRPGDATHFDRKLFRVEGMGAGSDTLLGETESADARGIVSQMMRHNEAAARISLGQTLEIVEHYKGILRQRDMRIAELEEKQTEVWHLYEKLMTMQHQRDLETMREKRVEKKVEYMREKVDLLAPVLVGKLLGAGKKGDGGGAGAIFNEETLRQLLKSLQPNQISSIMSMLTPEQVVALAEIYEQYGKRDVERAEKAERAAASHAEASGAAAPPGE